MSRSPCYWAGSRLRALKLAAAALERVGLPHRAEHFSEEMSGGEMQRVAIARALVTQPDAVVCDEPTGNLDTASSKEIFALLRSLPEDGKRAVVMVTHDANAATYGDRLVRIRDGLLEATESLRPERIHRGEPVPFQPQSPARG